MPFFCSNGGNDVSLEMREVLIAVDAPIFRFFLPLGLELVLGYAYWGNGLGDGLHSPTRRAQKKGYTAIDAGGLRDERLHHTVQGTYSTESGEQLRSPAEMDYQEFKRSLKTTTVMLNNIVNGFGKDYDRLDRDGTGRLPLFNLLSSGSSRIYLSIVKCLSIITAKEQWKFYLVVGAGIGKMHDESSAPLEIARVTSSLGCKEGKIPFMYPGLPMRTSISKEASWNCLYEKFQNKLSGWKGLILSVGGKLTLCKLVALVFACCHLKSIEETSLGVQVITTTRCRGWLNWDKVITGINKGGLSIGSLKDHNVVLLAKWWWWFRVENETLWKSIILAIHGDFGKLGRVKNTFWKFGTSTKL
ncbi:hypothetical protein OSB04_004029 [Centaurea solstitialis]|uniref:Uncharacterized protein n=1 Tax=Centaurea solstitialis TaxID=347529 RepID=A0AA38TW17_9ASTR|nr:hypothetical protein OSB04_004029 [Centaurea solstitialis]